ncbi:MAG: glycogen/starch/alpha-glucan phosphorylase [Synechococcaceae cyanobacterium SM2_3_2]|nr:glycogen/starch/alpha-glucan phosphorylase [Synechococcaceae cyanobacterium SM2_3_2]
MHQLHPNLSQDNAGIPPQIEDDRTGIHVETLKRAFADNLMYVQGKSLATASRNDLYMALAYTVRDRLLQRWLKTAETYQAQDTKFVYYLSAEFLMGRQLGNALINVGLYDRIQSAVKEMGMDLNELLENEEEPGLGNGGLGRLAACFLDSLATLEIPAVGYGIRYEFGIFDQEIRDGWQVEIPDKWLRFGNPWELPRPEDSVSVKMGGYTEATYDAEGHYRVIWHPENTVRGIPYDTPVPGYDTYTVNILRLWKAEAGEEFDLDAFNAGDYLGSVSDKMASENISKVLYPNDNLPQGRELRLKQQYFFVSCSLQDILRSYLRHHDSLEGLPAKAAVQLNDTHPAIGIAEMMRLLVDEHGIPWERAWDITQQTFAYTNHTLLPEALERWPVSLFGRLLPRHLEIIYEINFRFMDDLKLKFPDSADLLERLSLIEETPNKSVRMANLASLGSHAINGVAALHTELLKEGVLKDFYTLFPEKFSNKTNGVTPRRWILLANPELANLITSKIGSSWTTHFEHIRNLEPFVEEAEFRANWRAIKRSNKIKLAHVIQGRNHIHANPDSIFDVLVKRLHEYKRQLLKVLHIITLYNRLKANPNCDIVPRTFVFGGKAAPGYVTAKLIIKLINAVADVVNRDPNVRERLKVAFIADFNVSLGQHIYPAADISEQISTAGKEASGTGNMKFSMNGALTVGTLDGANVEIRAAVGAENFFLFGLKTPEVAAYKAQGYRPITYYQQDAELREVIDRIRSGDFSNGDANLFRPLVESLLNQDTYMLMADYRSYIDCQDEVDQVYLDQERWTRMSILNATRMGSFSSDRTIRQYCDEIWGVQSVKIQYE